jgi:lysophospholipase L1-like esterase
MNHRCRRISATIACLALLVLAQHALAQTTTTTGVEPNLPVLIAPYNVGIRYVGRFDVRDANSYRFAWSGCQIEFRFRGRSAGVLLADAAGGGPSGVRGNNNNYFNVLIDDKPPVVLPLEKGRTAYVLADGLADGEHTVKLFRRTEPLFNEVRFEGVLLEAGGKLLPRPPAPKRVIEFIGDSITAGYGNEANDAKDRFCQATQNNYLAYGAVTARALGADYVCLAWSGQGVYRDRTEKTDKTLPILYYRTLPNEANCPWDFARYGRYKADVVVINLGTNDFATSAPPQEEFLKAYRGLIETALKHHAGAHVFCCVGPMMSDSAPKDAPGLTTIRTWLTDMVAQYAKDGRKNIHYVEFDRQKAENGLGASYHPSVKTHQIMADKLVEAIRKEMGW